MSPLDVLREPTWQPLTWTLLHFLWQGLAVAAVAATLLYVCPLRNAHNRYLVYLSALAAMAACPLVTFLVIEVPEAATVASREVEMAASLPPVAEPELELVAGEVGIGPIGPTARESHLPLEPPETAPSDTGDSANLPVPVTWEAKLPRYADAIQPYCLMTWIVGVLLLAVRLSLSWLHVRWLAWGRRVIPADLAVRAAMLGERLGLRFPPRVCVSEKIREAIVVGLWRPLVLLPASWLTEMTPEVLEAVMAHELAHVRRLDLWVNLLQRLMETLLFYHPAVWWLSRRLSLEREMCADQLAVGATSKRLVYATALEQLGLMRLSQTAPQLGASIGGNRMVLLNRVGNILGSSPSNERTRWWPAGLAALAVPLAIWLASTSIVSPAASETRAEAAVDEIAVAADESTLRERMARIAAERNPRQGAASPMQELNEMFAEIQREIQRLTEAGEKDTAADFVAKLDALRGRLDGSYRVAKSDTAEIHVVGLYKGRAAPPGVLEGTDRFTKGYAEVRVTYAAQPLILVLCGEEPIHWQVKPDEGVEFDAVILTGRRSQSVAGLPDGTLVLRRVEEEGTKALGLALSPTDERFSRLDNRLLALTGKSIVTSIGRREHDGRPLVVGPENQDWRVQHTLVETRQLHRRATRFDRDRRRASVAKLSFRAVYFSRGARNSDHPYGGERTAVFGDFTISGPIESSLRPLPASSLRRILTDPKEKLQFGLNHHLELVLVDPAATELSKIPLAAGMRGNQFTSLAIDTKRRRLVLSPMRDTPDLHVYDLEAAQWSVLDNPEHRLAAMTYVAQEDVLYAVTRHEGHSSRSPDREYAPLARGAGATILKIDPATGKRLDEIKPSQPIDTRWADSGGVQMIHVDGRLVVVGHPLLDRWNRYVSRLYVVDPKSGNVLYSGIVQPHDGQSPAKNDLLAPPPDGGGLLDTLWKRFAAAGRAIDTLRREGNAEQADRLAQRVATLRERLKGSFPEEKDADPALHLVGIHVADGTVVKVTDKSRPIVLALCAYNPSKWTIQLAPGVRLRRVIVGGYHSQKVVGVPEGTPLSIYTYEDGTGGFHAYKKDEPEYAKAARKLRDVTGLDVTTFQGAYQCSRTPIVVGPENADWRIQYVLHGLDAVLHASKGKLPAERTAALP